MSQPLTVTVWRNRICGWTPMRVEDADTAWRALPAEEFDALTSQLAALRAERDEVVALLGEASKWVDPWRVGYPVDLGARIDAVLAKGGAK